jgi:hypothetical protein
MVKFKLTVLFLFFYLLQGVAQIIKLDSTSLYKKKSLTYEEVNIVSSYYSQDGNHSAVTGGIGTEKLTDISNTIDVKFYKEDGNGIRKNYGLEIGLDSYTSASSDNIDLKKSSASSEDARFYPSINYSVENRYTGFTKGAHLSFSTEWDYKSIGGGISMSKSYPKKGTELSLKINGFYDTYQLIIAQELRKNPGGGGNGKEGTSPRTSLDASFTLAQVLHNKLQAAIIIDAAYQQGLLSTPFHRVYLNNGSLVKEKLPDSRFKIPLGMRLNWYMNDKFVARSFYRYFKDSWGLSSHTVNLDLSYRVSPSLVLGPNGRFYTQSGNKYFGAHKTLPSTATYVTSDYDLSDFNSQMYGLSAKYNTFKSGGYTTISSIEMRAGLYKRNDGLKAWIVTVGLNFSGKKG